MFDLGSGDGRIVLMAASKFKAEATGVELDASLARQSAEEIRRRGLDKTAHVIHGDILKQDYSSADVITAYLLPKAMQLVRPILEKQLKKGSRVVAHDFEMTGWKPEKVESIEDDGKAAVTPFIFIGGKIESTFGGRKIGCTTHDGALYVAPPLGHRARNSRAPLRRDVCNLSRSLRCLDRNHRRIVRGVQRPDADKGYRREQYLSAFDAAAGRSLLPALRAAPE